MNISPTLNWKKVSRRQFEQALSVMNPIRDGFSNADIYRQHGTDKRIAAKILSGPNKGNYLIEDRHTQ